jgi:hypothetical protein
MLISCDLIVPKPPCKQRPPVDAKMKLLTAHKILISTAAVFFFFFGLWELRNYSHTAETWAVFRGVLYMGVGLGFGVYFRNLDKLYK